MPGRAGTTLSPCGSEFASAFRPGVFGGCAVSNTDRLGIVGLVSGAPGVDVRDALFAGVALASPVLVAAPPTVMPVPVAAPPAGPRLAFVVALEPAVAAEVPAEAAPELAPALAPAPPAPAPPPALPAPPPPPPWANIGPNQAALQMHAVKITGFEFMAFGVVVLAFLAGMPR